ncbi:uncharacterized protein LOC111889115 isoform X1 [Lactuca sativa]|uniref:2-oxoacid dehydrogenase acyltransferase catalytic domain-containing protein n=1 Tax=Lactuca sativa TaxID=4236 RepID=A0A9R1XVF9_LACSA|nr:uncharacterized protein LOC111889115 isoform X1 [Lactuca sativa]XP_052625208.1 uncharacterized protein LOC111889115 isoform X1 [Lactuca sativa]XP_052625209.1 uncharacterized protein LOC111889115 isoform X1 [Lactuca sativa]KAJ0227421.1 hypothetical protein LSAT_V11C100009830 [Lactuca sativa]
MIYMGRASFNWMLCLQEENGIGNAPQCFQLFLGAGTFTLSNLGMFGVDRFDAILPPGTGAIMAVGASEPTVVATKDGRIGMKSQMQGKRKVVKSPIDITFKHFKSANAKTRCVLLKIYVF